MKTLTIILCSFLLASAAYTQQYPVKKNITLDINSDIYIRVFDGFLLEAGEATPDHIEINTIIKSNDPVRLKKLGITYSGKPYMFLNSDITDVRRFLYIKAKVSSDFQGMNLPIVLNNELITPDKYVLLAKLDTEKVLEAKFLGKEAGAVKENNLIAYGVIVVITH